jgi:hypothetical protein
MLPARSPFGQVATIVDEEDRLLIEVHLGRASVARRRPRPRGHRGASRECAGSAGVLSGRERFG